ncbi:hypothetical protein OE88DRAFT_1631450, partial [Heliocybe sulcata]
MVAYVTDYITKTPLKTYTIFQTIRDVFDRQTTMIGGTLRDQEKARKLLTQIVNSLSVKMEIGAPMAAAYLLGNPDHYTSHHFCTVYWKSYVNERSAEGYTAYTPIMDYIYRPKQFEHVCLYDWVRLSHKRILTNIKSKSSSSTEVTAVDLEPQKDTMDGEKIDHQELTFLPGHPQHGSHYVTLTQESSALVPNFIGGSLPRRDTGNREFYCVTMLTLFKPWKTGLDLKSEDDSWDDTFSCYHFTSRQKELLSFFNTKYECYDARDDYSRQRKAGISGIPTLHNKELLQHLGIDGDQEDELDYAEYAQHPEASQYDKLGNQTLKHLREMNEMESILKGAGWL